jgi:alpha-galactosidase/6-phospho-beta-glucosidase family protein
MPEVKVVIIGGGSVNWAPAILTDLMLKPDLEGSTVVLQDIDAEALELTLAFGQRLLGAAERRWTLEATTDRRAALKDADYVILVIAVGGLEAVEHDLAIPLKYGIYQSVGDTVGPGGLVRALRNIPVVYQIARDMEELCPGAWLINYTNPLTTLTRTVSKHTRIRVIGVCHELTGVLGRLRRLFDLGDAPIETRVVGINHFVWLLGWTVEGRDGYEVLRAFLQEHPPDFPYREELPGSPASAFEDRLLLKWRLFETFGLLPAAGDRHLAEFFPYFLTDGTNRGADYGIELTNVDQRRTIAGWRRDWARRVVAGEEAPLLTSSGEAAAEIICALEGLGDGLFIVNLPNKGQVANLPRDAVVETMGRVSRDRVEGVESGGLPPALLTLVLPHVLRQEMIVRAAMTGDRALALQVLATDPLLRDFASAGPMLDELLLAHRAHLPQF